MDELYLTKDELRDILADEGLLSPSAEIVELEADEDGIFIRVKGKWQAE